MGNLTLNNGGIITNSTNLPNLDLRYGPYESVQEAYGSLGDIITPGLVVGILENDEIIEYVVDENNQLTPKIKLKTINNQSILGTGNVDLATPEQLSAKQDALVSGTNIKTINNQTILGDGNITIQELGYSIVVLDSEAEMPDTPDSNTLYFIKESAL